MAHRDVLGEVILQLENLKFSSPLRRDHNEDDNKENILGGQGIPKIKSADSTSCTSTLPILSPKDKTPTYLKNNKISNSSVDDLDTYESPSLSPELKKSSEVSHVGRSISPVTKFVEDHNKSPYQNGILDKTITKNEIEFDSHLGEQGNSTFTCDSTTCLEDYNYISETFENEENGKVQLEIAEDLQVCHNLKTAYESDPKNQVSEPKLTSLVTPLHSKVELKAEIRQNSSDNCQELDNLFNSKILDTSIKSELGDSLEVTQVISSPTSIEKKPIGSPNVDSDEKFKEDILGSNHESVNLYVNDVISNPYNCDIEISDVEEDKKIELSQSSAETAISEVSVTVSLHSLSTESKELLPDPQNRNLEEHFSVCKQSNSDQPESCNDLSVETSCESLQILNEANINISINTSASSIPKEENNKELLEDTPNKIVSNNTLQLSNYTENENEHQKSDINIEHKDLIISNTLGIFELRSSIDAPTEQKTSLNHTGDQKLLSIDSDESIVQQVQDFKCSAEVCATESALLHNRSEVKSNSSECLSKSDYHNCSEDITKKNIFVNEEGLCSSLNAKSDFTVSTLIEPRKCSENVLEINTSEDIEFHDAKEVEEPENSEYHDPKEVEEQVSTVYGEKVVQVCESRLEENNIETNEINLKHIEVGSHEKNESIQVLTEPVQEEICNKTLDNISSSIKKSETDTGKMTELNEKLQQEISDLKLELNAAKQAKATLELEIGKKDEIILMTQAESIKKEQQSQHDIKLLREQLKEKSSVNEKDALKELEEALKECRTRESQAVTELNARIVDVLNYRKIMEEYDKSIATRFADYQKLKDENKTVNRHLANLELSFSDLHQKYERTKTIIYGLKTNEDKLRESLTSCEDSIHKQEERYESLKAHAKAQIEKSNKEIMKYKEKYDNDVNKLNAIIKRLEIKSAALEISLDQKTKECTALAALCDEVTGKKV